MTGTLFIVATPIGNLEDISARALRVLGAVAVCAAEDTRHTARLLAHYGIRTPMTSLHEHNEHRKTPLLIGRLQEGEDVALVTDAGTPGVSDPGTGLIRATADAGIPIRVIPGASALTAALSGAGFPLNRVLFAGFAPARAGERRRWLGEMTKIEAVLVFFEAPHRLHASLAAVQEAFGNVEVVVAHELTKIHESWHRGRLDDLISSTMLPTRGEFTILVNNLIRAGEVAAAGPPDPRALMTEFGYMTEKGVGTRREAVAKLAERWSISKREVYAAIESQKKLGKTQK